MKKTFKVIFYILFYIILIIIGIVIGGVVIPIWNYKHHKKKKLEKLSAKAQIASSQTLQNIANRLGVQNE